MERKVPRIDIPLLRNDEGLLKLVEEILDVAVQNGAGAQQMERATGIAVRWLWGFAGSRSAAEFERDIKAALEEAHESVMASSGIGAGVVLKPDREI